MVEVGEGSLLLMEASILWLGLADLVVLEEGSLAVTWCRGGGDAGSGNCII